jgi:uncharacterized YigZ family protein
MFSFTLRWLILYFCAMDDVYYTIEAPAVGEYREKGSRFLAYVFPLNSEEEIKQHLDIIRKQHPSARQCCYAYQLKTNQESYRMYDDGEPSGTAGRPIYGQIQSAQLSNVMIIVVRYFGGVLLGTGGIIHAYKTAAATALEHAMKVEKTWNHRFRIVCNYAQLPSVMRCLKTMKTQIKAQDHQDEVSINVEIRKRDAGKLQAKLNDILEIIVHPAPENKYI